MSNQHMIINLSYFPAMMDRINSKYLLSLLSPIVKNISLAKGVTCKVFAQHGKHVHRYLLRKYFCIMVASLGKQCEIHTKMSKNVDIYIESSGYNDQLNDNRFQKSLFSKIKEDPKILEKFQIFFFSSLYIVNVA